MRSGPGTVFVGRRRELTALAAALADPPALVLVEGEAGIGKTRLVHEWAATVPPEVRVMEVVCPPLAEPFPLGPVVEALQRTVPEPEGLKLSPLAGVLRPLFPEWAARLPPAVEPLDDPKATRHRLLRALAEVIERIGVDVLIFEDAHWADSASLELLLMLAASPRKPMSVVVTYRPADVSDGSVLRRIASRSHAGTGRLRLSLDAFDVRETTELIGAIFGTDQVSAEFGEFLHARTAGVPLAVEESVSLLRDRGDIFPADGGWGRRAVRDLQVPPTVRDSVLERVERLDPAARRILEAAAIMGEPADIVTLAQVAELPDARVRGGLAGALGAGLLLETAPGRYGCRHALASRAIEEALPISERRHLHRKAAHALLLAAQPPVARLSRHFREAGDVAEWSRFGEAAADLALKSGDDHAAMVALYELLTSSDHPPERRSRLARNLGEAATWGVAALGDLGRRVADALATVVRDIDDLTGERGEIRLLLGRLLFQLGEFEAAADQIEVAVDELRDRPESAIRAMASLAFPRGHSWPAARHREWLDRATNLQRRLGTSEHHAWLAVERATALLMLGEEAGWAATEQMSRYSVTLFQKRQVARGLMNVGHAAIAWGRYPEARRRLRASIDWMRSTGYERLLNSAQLTLAHLDWQEGSWKGLAQRVEALGHTADTLPEARLEAAMLLALNDLNAGSRASAERRLRQVLDEASRRGLVDLQVLPAATLGRLCLADGDAQAAMAVTAPVVDLIARKDMWLWATDVLPPYLDALVLAGRAEAVSGWVDCFTAGLGDRDAPAPQAAVRTARGIAAAAAGDHKRAAAEFGDASRAWAALPRPLDELLCAERRVRSLLTAGDRDALAALEPVQTRLARLGAGWDADRVAQLLRHHGVDVARAWRGGRRGYGDQLSPRELEVVRLVARGLTNRKAAEALFLSPRTVDRHLSAAMRKLGVSSRTALAVTAHDAGLLADDSDGSR